MPSRLDVPTSTNPMQGCCNTQRHRQQRDATPKQVKFKGDHPDLKGYIFDCHRAQASHQNLQQNHQTDCHICGQGIQTWQQHQVCSRAWTAPHYQHSSQSCHRCYRGGAWNLVQVNWGICEMNGHSWGNHPKPVFPSLGTVHRGNEVKGQITAQLWSSPWSKWWYCPPDYDQECELLLQKSKVPSSHNLQSEMAPFYHETRMTWDCGVPSWAFPKSERCAWTSWSSHRTWHKCHAGDCQYWEPSYEWSSLTGLGTTWDDHVSHVSQQVQVWGPIPRYGKWIPEGSGQLSKDFESSLLTSC